MNFDYTDDANFNYIESGTYPSDYIGLKPAIIYNSLPERQIYGHHEFPPYLNVNAACVVEYWAKIPKEIKYSNCLMSDDVYISTFGRVYNRRYKRFYKLCYSNRAGYIQISGLNVHRAVLYTFNPIPNFREMTVDHISCDPSENYLWNLRWMTIQENNKYAVHHGRLRGATDDEVELVCRAALTEKYSYYEIANAVGISYTQVLHIMRGDSHRDISSKFGIDYNKSYSKYIYNAKNRFIVPLEI